MSERVKIEVHSTCATHDGILSTTSEQQEVLNNRHGAPALSRFRTIRIAQLLIRLLLLPGLRLKQLSFVDAIARVILGTDQVSFLETSCGQEDSCLDSALSTVLVLKS